MSPSSPTPVSLSAASSFDYHDPYPSPEPGPPPRSVIAIVPESGPTTGGTAITISGIDFVQGATVTFGTAPATDVIVVDSMSIMGVTPPGAEGWVDVVVTNPNGQPFTLPGGFTYIAEQSSGESTTITITSAGASPKAIQVAVGSRVTFVNNDSRNHDMQSDPHPLHTDCAELNEVGFIPPGGSAHTGAFLSARTCGFHDHNDNTNEALMGRIVIKALGVPPPPTSGLGPYGK
jgi:plastocyanin